MLKFEETMNLVHRHVDQVRLGRVVNLERVLLFFISKVIGRAMQQDVDQQRNRLVVFRQDQIFHFKLHAFDF